MSEADRRGNLISGWLCDAVKIKVIRFGQAFFLILVYKRRKASGYTLYMPIAPPVSFAHFTPISQADAFSLNVSAMALPYSSWCTADLVTAANSASHARCEEYGLPRFGFRKR